MKKIRREIITKKTIQSKYGVLNLQPIIVEYIQNSPVSIWIEQISEQLDEISCLSGEKDNWQAIYDIVLDLYDFPFKKLASSSSEDIRYLDEFLDSIFFITSLNLLENGIITNSINPCYCFCTSRLIKNLISFSSNITNDILFQTAAVYLYSLSCFLNGWRDHEKFGPAYVTPIQYLNLKKPEKNFISWALKMAVEDEKTREYVRKYKPIPSL